MVKRKSQKSRPNLRHQSLDELAKLVEWQLCPALQHLVQAAEFGKLGSEEPLAHPKQIEAAARHQRAVKLTD